MGIDTFTKKGVTYINGQVIDPYGFDYVEVPLSNISDTPVKVNPKSKPIINEQTKQKNRDQEAFRLKAEKEALEGNQDLVVQTKTKKEVLDHGSITSKEQSNINKIIGVGKDKDETFATAYDHSLPAEEGGGIGGGVINRRMTGGAVPLSRKTHYEKHFPEKTIPKSFYKKISQLQGKLQKIALISENNTRPSMKSLAQEITNKFKANKLRGSVKGGFTYDPTSDTLLDASIKDQALQIRKIFGGQKGKNLGLNSITEDDMGNKPITDIGIISNQLHKLEKSGKKPILGGYKKGLNASFSIHGSDKDILKSLPHGQESSLSIEPNGNSYLLYPNGKKELITQ